MNQLRVAIRTEGGAAVGLGHIRRCLNLAHALTRIGAQVSFILGKDAGSLELVRSQGLSASSVEAEHDIEQSADALEHSGATVLVTDSYQLSADYWEALREHVELLVAVDDLARGFLPVDVVVNGAANATALTYSALPSTRLFLGPLYMMLREEFAQKPAREFPVRIGCVLITVGGSDPSNLTTMLMEQALRLEGVSLDVVCGPFFHNRDEIRRVASRWPGRVSIYDNPQDMRSLMLKADLAITGGGQTTYELAATETPAVAVCVAENQRGNLAGLEREGTLVQAGDAGSPRELAETLARRLKELDSDPARRRQMGVRGRQVVDGLGAQRVAQAIAEEHGRRREARG